MSETSQAIIDENARVEDPQESAEDLVEAYAGALFRRRIVNAPPDPSPYDQPQRARATIFADDLAALRAEIEAAHAACDGPVSRMGMDGARPLAERASALRKMVDDRWRMGPPASANSAAEVLKKILNLPDDDSNGVKVRLPFWLECEATEAVSGVVDFSADDKTCEEPIYEPEPSESTLGYVIAFLGGAILSALMLWGFIALG